MECALLQDKWDRLRSKRKTTRILCGPGPPDFKIGCDYRIRLSGTKRTGPHSMHIHMAMTAVPYFPEFDIKSVSR